MKIIRQQTYVLIAAIAILLFFSCKKNNPIPATDNGGGNAGNGGGLVSGTGIPVGNAETKLIGAGGGSFTTTDGRLTIDFPAGALQTDKTVSIQPITNTTTGAAGNAYRITPHLNFDIPVKITFNYSDSDLVNTIPAAMAIAYQDAQNTWQAVGGGSNDATNRKVTVYTDHFSDWSLFKKLVLSPSLNYTAPGGKIKLNVLRTVDFADDLEIPTPGTPVKDSIAASIKEWKLDGEGVLAPNGSTAYYTAPAQIPARNPVAVSVTLNTKGPGVFILVANIYIGGEGITFRIDNGPWINAPCAIGVMTVGSFTQVVGGAVVNNSPAGAISLKWSNYTLFDNINWEYTLPEFNYAPGGTNNYWHFYAQGNSVFKSPGGISFYRYGSVGEYVSGVFLLEKSGKSYVANNSTNWEIHKIEGFFNVKRAN
jgi:hypothetical protein